MHDTDTDTNAQTTEKDASDRNQETGDPGVDDEYLVEEFGADRLTDGQVERFPDHPSVRRGTFFAGRDVDRYLAAVEEGQSHAIVTGIGPSGPMHLGHVLPFYFARRLQAATGATVYVPLSDDEKYFTRDLSFAEVGSATRENLRDLLAVGFDPERTRIVVDTADADVVYPVAARLAKHVTQSTVEATYGDPDNAGQSFYPAVQATHLLLPQLVNEPQPTLVPIAVDQDPHVRVCRDLAAREDLPVEKPAALLGRYLPGLEGPGKMSSSGDAPSVLLTDGPDAVARKIRKYAYSGGRSSLEEHRREGGDPAVDVAFQYLRQFFEPDDREIERIATRYRNGELTSGELKRIAIDRVNDFLGDHQRRREAIGDLDETLRPYRLAESERERALRRAGVPGSV